MRSFAVILLALAYCEAKPNPELAAVASLSPDSYILNGEPAGQNEFPWQLSQQRLGGSWSHSCGASLLSATYALSAAHCLEGAAASIIRVVAGTNDRLELTTVSDCQSYKLHESYGTGPGTFPNDIAIITLATPIPEDSPRIQYASLPNDNSDQFVGRSVVLSGWGRNSASNVLPQQLLKATIGVISTADCNQRMAPVSGASVTDNMICFFDTATSTGSCNGDSGGPANINYPSEADSGRVVAGVTSWGIQGGGACLPSYPSVYTRTSAYLDWIRSNTP